MSDYESPGRLVLKTINGMLQPVRSEPTLTLPPYDVCDPNLYLKDIILSEGPSGWKKLQLVGVRIEGYVLISDQGHVFHLDTSGSARLALIAKCAPDVGELDVWRSRFDQPLPQELYETEWMLVNALLNEQPYGNLFQALRRRFPRVNWPKRFYDWSKDGSGRLFTDSGDVRSAIEWSNALLDYWYDAQNG